MIANVDFTENTKGAMRDYQDGGPFVTVLATDLGQVGFYRCEKDGSYLLRVEPFSAEGAEKLAPSLSGWTEPDICLTENRAFFSVVADSEPVCREKLQLALTALRRRGGSIHMYPISPESLVAGDMELLDEVFGKLIPAAFPATQAEQAVFHEDSKQSEQQEAQVLPLIDFALAQVLALSPAQRRIAATLLADPEVIADYERRMGLAGERPAQKTRTLTFGEPQHEGEYCLRFEEYNEGSYIHGRIERALREALPDWTVRNWGGWMEIRARSNDGRRDDETIFAAVRTLVGDFTFSDS